MELETRIVKYRDTVALKIKEAVPEIRDVGPHAGSFNIEAVKRFSMITPSARVVFLNMRKIARNNIGHLIGPATMVVFLVTKDPFINRGFAPALDLAERVADVIELNTWGFDWCAAAQVREIEPYYSEEIDKIGVAVTGITFTQEIQIGRDRHLEDESKEHLWGFSPNVPKHGFGRQQDEDWEELL
jgi:hypothetical protein